MKNCSVLYFKMKTSHNIHIDYIHLEISLNNLYYSLCIFTRIAIKYHYIIVII